MRRMLLFKSLTGMLSGSAKPETKDTKIDNKPDGFDSEKNESVKVQGENMADESKPKDSDEKNEKELTEKQETKTESKKVQSTAVDENEPHPDDSMPEKEKNFWYVVLEYCVPYFPSGLVLNYTLTGVREAVIKISSRESFAGFLQPSKTQIFEPKAFQLPVDIATRLLEVDEKLVMLRYKLSKRRMSDLCFWERYFTELIITVREYVTAG
mmetsp:Transcript_16162/g.24379  ORF Transcript_16162/g.24379 Transcript_16162/m.24379 type:complete len:211 (-) Transcript_16162:171-803(-)